MATGYRINGLDLEEGWDAYSEIVPFEWVDEENVLSSEYILPMFSSNRYRKNGQPIKQAVGKSLLKTKDTLLIDPYPALPTCPAKFCVGGVTDERIGAKGQTPHGRLVAAFTTAGTHTIDLSDDGYILVDGQKTDIYIADETLTYSGGYIDRTGMRTLSFLVIGGGGGGAGSSMTYCSAGGGGGVVILLSLRADYERYLAGTSSSWKSTDHRFPMTIQVGAGGVAGDEASAGSDGEGSYVMYNGLTKLLARGGGGGETNDGAGGAGGGNYATDAYNWYHYFSYGGAGGGKEGNGGANSEEDFCSWECYGYNKEDMLSKYGVSIHGGGASSGNNYGGGGGASALAEGAPANSRRDGVAGTLGAGGSGAGFTAFNQSAGGKGGDGAVYVFY